MRMSSLLRLLKFAVLDFGRNIWLSTTTVAILTLTLVSVQVLLAVNVLGRIAVDELESRMDIRVQFRPTATESDVDAIRLRLQQRSEVRSVTQRSRAQVLEEFQRAHRSSPDVSDALTELGTNPFGPELHIALHRPEDFPIIAKLLSEEAIAERIVETGAEDRAALTAQLSRLTARIRGAVAAMSIVFLGITLLIIVNAMRIATYTRRDEAAIMKLVGASNWFIRTPFLITGIIASAIATLLVVALTLPALGALEPTLQALVGPRGVDVATFFRHYVWVIAAAEFAGLSMLTVAVSAIAIRRYLRV